MESRSPWYLESNKEPYSDDRYVSHTKLVYIRENYIMLLKLIIYLILATLNENVEVRFFAKGQLNPRCHYCRVKYVFEGYMFSFVPAFLAFVYAEEEREVDCILA